MSDPGASADAAQADQPSRRAGFWLRELPFGAVLLLTLFGVAYTSVARQPIVGYWEFLAVAVGILCVVTGWPHARAKDEHIRLIWTQALHWIAFLVAMNLILLGSVQRMLNTDATGLAILMLLALGTFVAGVHIRAWEICALGVVMALCVPGIAWIEQSALLLLLCIVVLAGIGAALWWTRRVRT
jgi:hypothetical protein